ncbi:putative membrane protein [Bacillus methanolicus MGA3]|uniref:Putative membrane protein n=2 Tax=Bacillus methanolicus TaxID=1471 RepID=A0A068LSZ4_BACMM|nr:putative membrane protein [Bacillus methanolicus MGA3]
MWIKMKKITKMVNRKNCGSILNDKGMTLIELLAIIVILGIISAIAGMVITKVIQNTRDRAFVANALAMKEAATYYIRQEIAEGHNPKERISYKELADRQFIDSIIDPDSGNFLQPSEESYVEIIGTRVAAVCLKGEKRNLCSKNGPDKAIPIEELSADLISSN